jgi:hypothetical protein
MASISWQMGGTVMKSETIEIVDRGRGPQLSTSRMTVLDVFYYLLGCFQKQCHSVLYLSCYGSWYGFLCS